jgi:hypothetical protein
MGSMSPWRALRPVGTAQRPWLSGPAPGGLPADAWASPNGDQLHARPMSRHVTGRRLRFGRGRGLISRINAQVHERCGVPLLVAVSLLDWADLIDRTQIAGPRPDQLRRWAAQALAGRGAVLLENRVTEALRQ